MATPSVVLCRVKPITSIVPRSASSNAKAAPTANHSPRSGGSLSRARASRLPGVREFQLAAAQPRRLAARRISCRSGFSSLAQLSE